MSARLSHDSAQWIEAASKSAQTEALKVLRRPLRTLPAAWHEAGSAERMAEWIGRNVPRDERLIFTYGDARWVGAS